VDGVTDEPGPGDVRCGRRAGTGPSGTDEPPGGLRIWERFMMRLCWTAWWFKGWMDGWMEGWKDGGMEGLN